jgi:hypothetical protein
MHEEIIAQLKDEGSIEQLYDLAGGYVDGEESMQDVCKPQ